MSSRFGQLLVALLVGAGMAAVAVLALQARQDAARERDARIAAEAEASLARSASARAEREARAAADSAAAATARAMQASLEASRAAADAAHAARLALVPPAPIASDSARYWRQTSEHLTEEVGELRQALTHADGVIQVQQGTIARLTAEVQASYAREDSTAAAFARFRASVEATLAAREPRCRVPGTFGQVDCPSRTTSALLGALTTLAAVQVIDGGGA